MSQYEETKYKYDPDNEQNMGLICAIAVVFFALQT